MMAPTSANEIVRFGVAGILYSLAEGTLLASIVWLLLRLSPRRNSGTRFAIWFSTLVAMALLPCLSAWPGNRAVSPAHSGITLPTSVAYWIFWAWMVMAVAGLVRVAAALWQLRTLRKSCVEIGAEGLSPEVQKVLADFRSRSVAVHVSSRLEVPTAIGFLKPVIVMPSWLIKVASAAELEYVLLHELAHLRRHDAWTNLTQKVVKALLFFHPWVWWIEGRLSLDREMACDDAVLAQTANPSLYARCLTDIAEKSFVRRQMTLAQTVVSRVVQLSLRLQQILSSDRPATTRLWRPAVPLIATFALVSAFWGPRAPRLITFVDGPDAKPTLVAAKDNAHFATGHNSIGKQAKQPQETQLVLASGKFVATNAAPRSKATKPRTHPLSGDFFALGRYENQNRSRLLSARVPAGANYFAAYREIVFTSTGSGPVQVQQVSWQLVIWEVPADESQKKINRKT
ncbi:MAG TPA: M56 family metallopeptidase [Verrucomicrobiae bacterium]|jgi:beta-lactamase regulating signal transducer with metallopeptidase domain|nr:M56 family metallopeptidase [Verrucomicrobiae bacterium]